MPIKATVSKVEEDIAILKTADNQELRFPISDMDGTPAPGL